MVKDTKDWLELGDMIIPKGFFFVANKVNDLKDDFISLRGKNEYIAEISAYRDFGQDLHRSINKLISCIEEHINILDRFTSGLPYFINQAGSLKGQLEGQEELKEKFGEETNNWWEEIAKTKAEINRSAYKVIDNVSRLKIKWL